MHIQVSKQSLKTQKNNGMSWQPIFFVPPYQHTEVIINAGPYPIPADAKNIQLTVSIGDAEQIAAASGVIEIEFSVDGGITWMPVIYYEWNWQNVEGRDGIICRTMSCEHSIPEQYLGGIGRGWVGLSDPIIVGFKMEYLANGL
jgi:hypothetical protein